MASAKKNSPDNLADDIFNTGVSDSEASAAIFQFLELKYEEGDGFALMVAIDECARTGVAFPRWAAKAYRASFASVHSGKKKSWDEVFGKPFAKGKRAEWIQLSRLQQLPVAIDILQHKIERKSLLQEDFEEIAEKHGLNHQQVKRLWREYQARDWRRLF